MDVSMHSEFTAGALDAAGRVTLEALDVGLQRLLQLVDGNFAILVRVVVVEDHAQLVGRERDVGLLEDARELRLVDEAVAVAVDAKEGLRERRRRRHHDASQIGLGAVDGGRATRALQGRRIEQSLTRLPAAHHSDKLRVRHEAVTIDIVLGHDGCETLAVQADIVVAESGLEVIRA
eukprot:CAMPEP_0185506120 /NCGR_PEP_ID=MMETSP1366-20130426/38666_1 /TAXON_ID=38817 /ORGANISM="Gephyrocapsa oceanica, Strain RCC1303" /LENGTH=176 /DNA_ID=CAMNT_0028116241 /DNA_START=73 /DNA_END=604 /DNA_ORIENTATION=-